MMFAAIVALSLQAIFETPSPPTAALEVPFIAQPDDRLCGGAAMSMIFRYWGDAHADPRQFASLVDTRAGGIAANALIDAVAGRGWHARVVEGSIEALTSELTKGHPVVVMIGSRGAPYHYVVVTAVDRSRVLIHDPSWGPSRHITIDEFMRLWKRTGYWTLLVLPGEQLAAQRVDSHDAEPKTDSQIAPACDALIRESIREIRDRGLSVADDVLQRASARCPAAARRELAGVRFANGRWSDAADLATAALQLDQSDRYSWDLLGSSRFMSGNISAALEAWNQVGRPRIDLVRITGPSHHRYQSIAEALDLPINGLLTDQRWLLAARRLEELPGIDRSRLTLNPGADGYVMIDAAVSERATWPHAPLDAAGLGLRAAVNRDAEVTLPGRTGQGETWSTGWRWWISRPRVAFGFAAPATGRFHGVWRVDASWERQSYALGSLDTSTSPLIESRARGGIGISDWATPGFRYSATTGLDAWTDATTRRSLFVGGSLERRASNDRISATVDHTRWIPVDGAGAAFHSTKARIAVQSSAAMDGRRYLADVGADHASEGAPLGLWSGAGEGQRGDVPLRAHPLIVNGIVRTSGAVFGRSLTYANVEMQQWIASKLPLGIAVAGFADLARASRTQIDVGGGVRVHFPGSDGALRIDLARGTLDGSTALTVGWQFGSGLK